MRERILMGWSGANDILGDSVEAFIRLDPVNHVSHEFKVAFMHSLIDSLESEDADCLEEVLEEYPNVSWLVMAFVRAGYDTDTILNWNPKEDWCD